MDVVVIENGEQLDLSFAEADRLIALGLIYRCPECDRDGAHIGIDRTMDEAVAALEEMMPVD